MHYLCSKTSCRLREVKHTVEVTTRMKIYSWNYSHYLLPNFPTHAPPAAGRHSGTGGKGRRQRSLRERPPATAASRHRKLAFRKRSRSYTEHAAPGLTAAAPPARREHEPASRWRQERAAPPRSNRHVPQRSGGGPPALSRYHVAASGAVQSERSATPGRGSGLANRRAPGGGICPHGNESPGRQNATGLSHRDAQVLGGTSGSCSPLLTSTRSFHLRSSGSSHASGTQGSIALSVAGLRRVGGAERSAGRAAGQLLSGEPLAAARGRAGPGALRGGRLTAATPVRFKITVTRRSGPPEAGALWHLRGWNSGVGAAAARREVGGQPSPPAAGGDGPQEVTRRQPRGWVCERLSSKQREELRHTWQRRGLMGGHCATTGKPRLLCPRDRDGLARNVCWRYACYSTTGETKWDAVVRGVPQKEFRKCGIVVIRRDTCLFFSWKQRGNGF